VRVTGVRSVKDYEVTSLLAGGGFPPVLDTLDSPKTMDRGLGIPDPTHDSLAKGGGQGGEALCGVWGRAPRSLVDGYGLVVFRATCSVANLFRGFGGSPPRSVSCCWTFLNCPQMVVILPVGDSILFFRVLDSPKRKF